MSSSVRTIYIELRASAERLKADMADATRDLDRVGDSGKAAGGKISSGMDKAHESFGKVAKSATEAGLAIESIARAVVKYSGAAGAVAGNTDDLVTSYRALKFALDPTIFTAATIAVGVLAEETIRLTNARAKLIEQQALIAAKGGLSISGVEQSFSTAGLSGGNASSLISLQSIAGSINQYNPSKNAAMSGLAQLGLTGEEPDLLAKIAAGVASIEDPVKRAAVAVQIFGAAHAGEAIQQLTPAFADADAAARRWGLGLDTISRTQIDTFRRDMQELKRSLTDFSDADAALEKLKQTLEQLGAAYYALLRSPGWDTDLIQKVSGMIRPDSLSPTELAAPNRRLSPGSDTDQGLKADDMFATQQVAAINKQNSTAEGQRTLQESAQKRADEAYAKLQADQAERRENPQSPGLLTGDQRFSLTQQVQSGQQQAAAHKARADALEQDEAEAKAAENAKQAIAEAGVNNQIAANKRLADAKRQSLNDSLALEKDSAAVRIAGIADGEDRTRASAAVELAIRQQRATGEKAIDQAELKTYTDLVNKRAAIANEGLTVKDYTAGTVAKGDIAGKSDEMATHQKALDQSVSEQRLALGASNVTAERGYSEQVTKVWEQAWDRVKKDKDYAMAQSFMPAMVGFQSSQAVTGTLDKGAGQTQALQIEGDKIRLEGIYASMVMKTGADQIRMAQQLAALDSLARQDNIAGLQKQYNDDSQKMAELPAGDEKRVEMARQLADLYIKIGDEREKANNDDLTAANQIAALKRQQNLGNELGQDLANTIQIQLPQNLGNALASGIFGGGKKGEDVGTQVAKALKDTGKQLLGEGLTQIFEKLVAEAVIHTGLQAWFNAQFPASLTAQTSAMIAAAGVNTTALISAITASGAAGAGVSAGASAGSAVAGSVASGASAAATGGLSAIAPIIGGVISGLISAVATIWGDAKIIQAINGTTSAVTALGTMLSRGYTTASGSNPGGSTVSQGAIGNAETSAANTANSLSEIPYVAGILGSFGLGNGAPVRIVGIDPGVLTGFMLGNSLIGGLAGLLGFNEGGPVSRDMIAQVHGGEWVLNKEQVTGRAALPSFLAARFPSTKVNFPSTEDYMSAGGSAASFGPGDITHNYGHTIHAINIYESSDARTMSRELADTLKTQSPKFSKYAR